MTEPIEIRPEDIIRRPTIPGANPATGGFSIKDIKGYIQQARDLKNMLDDLGIDLGSLGLGGFNLPGKKDAPVPADRAPAIATAQQFKNFLKLMQIKYGDVTVNELLDKLRAEFGDCKLSTFIRGGGMM